MATTNLTELKKKKTAELSDLATSMQIEHIARSQRQDIIFNILKAQAKKGEDIFGDGVLEVLHDGFGFLRRSDCS